MACQYVVCLQIGVVAGYNLPGMKLNSKTRVHLVRFLLLGLIIGTLAWGIIERLFAYAGLPFSLNAGPIGFDIGVLSVHMSVNPGSLIGLALGYRLFTGA